MPQNYAQRVASGRVDIKTWLPNHLADPLEAEARATQSYTADLVRIAVAMFLRIKGRISPELVRSEIARPRRTFRAGSTKPAKYSRPSLGLHVWKQNTALGIPICERCDLACSRTIAATPCNPDRERLMEDSA